MWVIQLLLDLDFPLQYLLSFELMDLLLRQDLEGIEFPI
jgi:hypothetical protein